MLSRNEVWGEGERRVGKVRSSVETDHAAGVEVSGRNRGAYNLGRGGLSLLLRYYLFPREALRLLHCELLLVDSPH